jgi:hypothetical protein
MATVATRLYNYPRLEWWRYNMAVAAPVSKSPADEKHEHHHAAYAAETSGLLIIAFLLLVLSLIRYWPYIPWSAR